MVTGEKKESAEAAGSSLLSKRRKKSAPSFHGTILLRERVNCSRRAFGEKRETVARAAFVRQLVYIIRSGSLEFQALDQRCVSSRSSERNESLATGESRGSAGEQWVFR